MSTFNYNLADQVFVFIRAVIDAFAGINIAADQARIAEGGEVAAAEVEDIVAVENALKP